MQNELQEEINYIYGITKFAKKASLDNTRELLKRLGNPEQNMKIIHVSGTNGKGSVCAYLDGILQANGYRVGRFTSPHLVDIRERILLSGTMVSVEVFKETFQIVKRISLEMRAQGFEHPSFFEFLFGMGMVIFGKYEPDYVILETGLGGRLDATNAIATPILTILTSISLDHTAILGDTYEKIAFEKAGIMKERVPVVFMTSREDVNRVFYERAKGLSSPVYSIQPQEVVIRRIGDNFIDFCLDNRYYDSECFCVHSRAIYQAENAALAIVAAREVLMIAPEIIRRGIENTQWVGRMQLLRPRFVVDGAHNEDGVTRFLETAKSFSCEPKVLLMSAVSDKHYQDMIDRICQSELFERIEVGQLSDDRALGIDVFQQCFLKHPKQRVAFHSTVLEAYEAVMEAWKQGAMVFAAGSLYLVGEVLSIEANKKE